MLNLVPKRIFFTSGLGYHSNKLQSFELALRNASIEKCNIVRVSSICPLDCIVISKEEGIKELQPGQITFAVLAKKNTNELNRLVSAAVGMACPKDNSHYGYISEHEAFGESTKVSADFAEDLAATMLASSLGIELDPDVAWDERKQIYEVGPHQFVSQSIGISCEGHMDRFWTTVVACAVMLLD